MKRASMFVFAIAVVALLGPVAQGARGPESGDQPRIANDLLTGRPWIDRVPRSETERFGVYLLTEEDPGQGLMGIQLDGSAYSWQGEIFTYALAGDACDFHFLSDHVKVRSRFTVRQESNGDFDLVLELATDPGRRGSTTRYFSRVDWKDSRQHPAWLSRALGTCSARTAR